MPYLFNMYDKGARTPVIAEFWGDKKSGFNWVYANSSIVYRQ